ncbi:ABC transporter permease [Angustibacter luteus]|uniref:ABC transporter permease n=1 Tax=Angustibacter luteus TaxID=658456 RepID=A0ABW1JB40_9ACTN
MTTFGPLLRQRVRRDRWQLALWVAGTGIMAAFSTSAIAQSYGDDRSRRAIMLLATENPSILMLRGLPAGYGFGAFTFFEIYAFLALLAGLMSTFLAVRHTRAEEESGRADLVTATPAGRTVPLVATLAHGLLANVVLGLVVALGFLSAGLPVTGSFVAGAAVAAAGLAFLGLGLVCAQFLRTSRGANGAAAALVVLAYLLRGLGDSLSRPGADELHRVAAWPSWLSPIGWGQQTGAWTGNALWPLLLSLCFTGACGAGVLVLQERRDTGASLLPSRRGRDRARPALGSPSALAWRLQWPTILGWCVGGAATGLLAGSLTHLVDQVSDADENVVDTLRSMVPGTTQTLTQLLIAAMFGVAGVLAAACAVQVVLRLRQEESAGTAEVLLATPVDRTRWLLDYVVLGVVAVVLVMAATAVAAALALLGSGEDVARVGDAFVAGLAQLPAALLYLGVLALGFVFLPGVVIGLGWGLLALGVALGTFGGMVGAPQWLRDLSPFTHTPVPGAGVASWTGGLWMLALAVAATALAASGMRRRQLRP